VGDFRAAANSHDNPNFQEDEMQNSDSLLEPQQALGRPSGNYPLRGTVFIFQNIRKPESAVRSRTEIVYLPLLYSPTPFGTEHRSAVGFEPVEYSRFCAEMSFPARLWFQGNEQADS
jgi:hypothetical protein